MLERGKCRMNSSGVDLYLLAGVKTWPTYFREPAERLKAMSIEAGYANADVHVLYPYGDHTIPLLRQVRDVARDVVRRLALASDHLQLAIIENITLAEDSVHFTSNEGMHQDEAAVRFPSGGSPQRIASTDRDAQHQNATAARSPSGVQSPLRDAADRHPSGVQSPLRDAADRHPSGVQSPLRDAADRHPSGVQSPLRDAADRQPRSSASAGRPTSIAAPQRRPSAELAASPEPIVEAIRERSAGRVVVLIGHSGGGVAAYHAGRRLLAEGAVRDCRIVQIGSPKVRIHPALRDRTAYFYAADERGRRRDPITRFGTWGGIRRAASGFPVWDSRRWAPGHIAAITIDGGHKDYFALGPSGAPGQATNLERTAAAVLDWLVRSLRPARLPLPPELPLSPQPPAPDFRQPSPAQ